MNYRHIFHAGNICDVVKHAVLVLLIEHLRIKPAPFCVIDTHAGIGLYDLRDVRAQKTNEAQTGILRFLTAPALSELTAYNDALKSFNPGWQPGISETLNVFRYYSGSPLLAARLLRPQDRVIACELHPEDAQTLKRHTRDFPSLQVHHRDGYEAMHAFVPPAEKRGLVLIDPPYKSPEEFTRLVQEVASAYARWPQGHFIIWYPVKDRPAIGRFHEAMKASGIPRQFCAEFIYDEETRHDRLNGCGILLINPPWKFDEKLSRLMVRLHEAIRTTTSVVNVHWLAGDGEASNST